MLNKSAKPRLSKTRERLRCKNEIFHFRVFSTNYRCKPYAKRSYKQKRLFLTEKFMVTINFDSEKSGFEIKSRIIIA
jgi:hypothetical protein